LAVAVWRSTILPVRRCSLARVQPGHPIFDYAVRVEEYGKVVETHDLASHGDAIMVGARLYGGTVVRKEAYEGKDAILVVERGAHT
jgi:hypothetical protein